MEEKKTFYDLLVYIAEHNKELNETFDKLTKMICDALKEAKSKGLIK